MKVLSALVLAALLSGCASSPYTLGREAAQRGDQRTAEQQLSIAAREGNGAAWNDLGALYHRQGKIQQAIDAFTMAARYGDPTARDNLARNHLPVPRADLVAAPVPSSSDAAANILNGFNRGYQGGLTCNTIGMGMGDSRTVCR